MATTEVTVRARARSGWEDTMGCLVVAVAALSPRVALVIVWLIRPYRWDLAFSSWVVPFLGLLFLPLTTDEIIPTG